MKIAVMGTGYVGLVTGTCLANLGNDVTCVDIDEKKIAMLNEGKIPIFEPGLKELVEINTREKRITFTTDTAKAIHDAEVIFIAVGTPSDDEGHADLKYVFAVAESIGKNLNGYKVIVNKSTVPVNTGERVTEIIKEHANSDDFDVVSNPEFLREGEAIKDFTNPDRVVIGVSSKKAEEIMHKIYRGIERTGKPILFTDVKSAELIKYASNCMLATRISFMNMIAPLCEKVGANVKTVAKGMGLDARIGPRFLQAGLGYGGSCFPKDVKALIATLKENECNASILDAVEEINDHQKKHMIPKLEEATGGLSGKTVALWGLSFKPKTDDIREAPSLVIIEELKKKGASIVAFDPVAQEMVKKMHPEMSFAKTPYDALEGADALMIVTEWDEFRQLDIQKMKSLLKNPVLIDGRNIYDPEEMRSEGFVYVSVGRK